MRQLAGLFMAFGGAYKYWLHDRLASEFGVMHHRAIGELGFRGPMVMSALGQHLCVTPRYVTAIVDALESDGLARRTPHPTDRRAIVVELTAEGEKCYEKGAEVFRALHEELLGVLTPEQQESLLGSLETLLAELQQRVPAAEPPSAA